MDKTRDILNKVVNTYEIEYEGHCISKEYLLETYYDFLSQTVSENMHNVGMVLHTGSICFDIITILFGALSSIVMCENNLSDVVDSLQKGDIVLYGTSKKQRYTFEGFLDLDGNESKEFIRLSQSSTKRTCISKKSWYKLEPYNGTSSRMDGRGIRNANIGRYAFISELLNINKECVPSKVDKSVVIVMSRDRADKILSGLSIRFSGGMVNILDIVTASYFTEGDEHYYGGNPGKTDAVLKLTGKVSVARDLILDKTDNEVIGIIVLGSDMITRGGTELIEIMNRRSLHYVFLACNIDTENAKQWIEEYEGIKVFACTQGRLRLMKADVVRHNKYTQELAKQVSILNNRQIEKVIISDNRLWNEASEVKKAILFIRKTDFISEQKDYFIIHTYALLNLILNSVFPLSNLEQLIDEGKVMIKAPSLTIEELRKITESFPRLLQEKAVYILNEIQLFFDEIYLSSEKSEKLIEYVKKYADKKIAIIIPNAYYEDVLIFMGIDTHMWDSEKLSIFTVNRFDNSIVYDVIFAVGDIGGKKFDLFRCLSSPLIITFIYDFQKRSIEYKYFASKRVEQFYNSKAGYEIQKNCHVNDIFDKETRIEAELHDDFDFELENYILHINSTVIQQYITSSLANTNCICKPIIAVGTFVDGERVFFTKAYKAYVLDDFKEEVMEVEVQNLVQGDKLIFTNNSNTTKDIVNLVLEELISTGALPNETKVDYQRTKYWKEKLKEYKLLNGFSYQQLANSLKNFGSTKHPVTVRTWLDEDLHIVGPKDIDSFRQISELIQDEKMLNDYETYKKACDIVRRMRIKILKQIAISVVNKYNGKKPKGDLFQELVYDNINNLAVVLQLADISVVQSEVPVNLTNKPISL